MPESRLERTRKLYQELNVRLPDTSKPHWWSGEYEKLFYEGILYWDKKAKEIGRAKIDPNA